MSQVQRRRRRALGVVAVVAALVGGAVGSGAGDDSPSALAEVGFCDEVSRLRVAGQGVMVRMGARATPDLMQRARSGEIGGVVLFPPPAISGVRLSTEIERLQEAAISGGNPRLLVAIDQEGGAVERLPALAPQISPFTIAQNDDEDNALLEGRATGFQLRELGIDVNLAPVLDVPDSEDHFMAPRAFGYSPEQVARLGLAFALGQRREAVAATAKHFPGLGRAAETTDLAPTRIDASRELLGADIEPFRVAVAQGIELVMMSSASYPALGGRSPAVLSPAVVTGLLRQELGYDGVIISDDLLAPAISLDHPRADAAVLAAHAGVDVLLFAARDAPGIAGALTAAMTSGELDEGALRASCARIGALKTRLATGEKLSEPSA